MVILRLTGVAIMSASSLDAAGRMGSGGKRNSRPGNLCRIRSSRLEEEHETRSFVIRDQVDHGVYPVRVPIKISLFISLERVMTRRCYEMRTL